mmetsp:Transcript_1965/g.3629  ORF Transcript_1965/g.3629 Transcript_1965/m.3629 type:complete len:246 (-) Transcript_1965:266-1003(-)
MSSFTTNRKGDRNGKKNGKGGRGARQRKEDAQTHDEALSRKLSKLLRHRIHANGLSDCLRGDGYVPLDRVLALRGFQGRTVDEIREVVKCNDKQRFSLLEEDGVLYIRANQGHSISGLNDDDLLQKIEFSANDDKQLIAIHGTYHKAWPAILQSGGLSRMTRQHVHLAADLPGEGGVISGMRSSCELIVYVDVRAAVLEGGLQFFSSANNVILTPGPLPLSFFTKVVNRSTNETIYPTPLMNPKR